MLQARYRFKTLLEEFLAKELYSNLPAQLQELLTQSNSWDIKISEANLSLFVDCKNTGLVQEIYAFREEIAATVKTYLDRKDLIDLEFDGEVFHCANTPNDCPSECNGVHGCLVLTFTNSSRFQSPDQN